MNKHLSKIIFLLLMILLFTSTAQAPVKRDVTLAWDPCEGLNIAGYRIYYDTDPGPPYDPDPADYADEGPPPIFFGKNAAEITLHGLTGTKDYFFTVTAFNFGGSESGFSNEVTTASSALQKDHTIAVAEKIDNEKDMYIERKSEDHKDQPDPEHLPALPVSSARLSEQTEDAGLLSPGDILMIEVPGQNQMSRSYDIDPNGNIYMISAGKVRVEGLNIAGLKKKLTVRLHKYITKGKNVSIHVLEQNRYIRITGGVHYPGWYRLPITIMLKSLIQRAGGLLHGVDYSRIILKRKTVDGYKEIRVKGKITLRANDIIVVPSLKLYKTKVNSGDMLFINIPGKLEKGSDYVDKMLKQQLFEVDKNGYIYVPDIGHIYVNNLTTIEIKKIITSKLPKYLARDSKVQVSIIEKRQFVQVLGHVANPGRYSVKEAENAQIAVNMAGGAVDGAIMSDVCILRTINDVVERIRVNLYQFTITGDPRLLTPLHENDILFVPISSNFGNVKRTLMPWTPPTERLEEGVKKKVRIFGAVQNTGIYEPREGMNLIDLLVMASGETDDADLSKMLIIRENKIDTIFNLKQFLNGESTTEIPKIYNGDTVYVKFRELTIFEPEEDKVFYVLGEVKIPNEYKLADNMTLFQGIALAGGLTEWADSDNIIIIRTVDGKQQNFRYNFNDGISGRLPELNIFLLPNDTIYVP